MSVLFGPSCRQAKPPPEVPLVRSHYFADRMVGYWTFNDLGGIARNRVLGDPALLVNGPTYGPYAPPGAVKGGGTRLNFGGGNAHVLTQAREQYAFLGDFSLYVEVSYTSLGAGETNMTVERDDDNVNWGVSLQTESAHPKFSTVIGGPGYSLVGAATLSTNVIYGICCCRAGTSMRLYVNGLEDANSPFSCGSGDLRLGTGYWTFGKLGNQSGRNLAGSLSRVVIWRNRVLTAADAKTWYHDPDAVFAPPAPRRWFVKTAAGHIVAIGQASETDLGQPVAVRKTKALGQAAEADLAQAIAVAKRAAILQANEINLAQALTPRKTLDVGRAAETDTAQTIGKAKHAAVAQAAEDDLAQAISHSGPKNVPVEQAAETDLARPISAAKRITIGQSAETNAALALSSLKKLLLQIAAETDEAVALVGVAAAAGLYDVGELPPRYGLRELGSRFRLREKP